MINSWDWNQVLHLLQQTVPQSRSPAYWCSSLTSASQPHATLTSGSTAEPSDSGLIAGSISTRWGRQWSWLHYRECRRSAEGPEHAKYSRSTERVLIKRPEQWFHFAPVSFRYRSPWVWGMHKSTQTHVCLQGLAYIRGHSLRDGVCKIFRKASRQVI